MNARKRTADKGQRRNVPPEAESVHSAPLTSSACDCYILECSDGTFYTGWAKDAARRLKVHNAGRGARYTRMRLPVKLVYVESQPDRTSAMKRERAIKRMPREKKKALIQNA